MSPKKSKKKSKNNPHNTLAAEIKKILSEAGNKPLNYKQISAQLTVKDAFTKDLVFEMLDSLLEKGEVEEPQKGKFKLIQKETFVEGKADLLNSGNAFVIV